MSGRSIMTDFEVSFKPLSSVFLCNLSLFVQNGRNLAKRFSDVSDRDIYTKFVQFSGTSGNPKASFVCDWLNA